MAGADRMTIEEVVRKVLLDEQADVLRAAVDLTHKKGQLVRRATEAHPADVHISAALT